MADPGLIRRRAFLTNLSLGLLTIALHPPGLLGCATDPAHATTSKKKPTASLIKEIILQTIVPIPEMVRFYRDLLGLTLVHNRPETATFKAGDSLLTFRFIGSEHEGPWYHFAFNIPENKLVKARDWQLKWSPIIPTPIRARDPRYPDDVRHFPHWNAHSVFFWDPAGNLLEYIARHDLDNAAKGPFTSNDILNISEIAFVVDDQDAQARLLHQQFALPVYPRHASLWWAMGDENGLLLTIPKRLWGENTANPKRFRIFETRAIIRGEQARQFTFTDYPYWVTQQVEG